MRTPIELDQVPDAIRAMDQFFRETQEATGAAACQLKKDHKPHMLQAPATGHNRSHSHRPSHSHGVFLKYAVSGNEEFGTICCLRKQR